jgi:hypothetical protein
MCIVYKNECPWTEQYPGVSGYATLTEGCLYFWVYVLCLCDVCLFITFPSTSQCSVFADTSFPIPFVQLYVNNYAFETVLWDSVSKDLACC